MQRLYNHHLLKMRRCNQDPPPGNYHPDQYPIPYGLAAILFDILHVLQIMNEKVEITFYPFFVLRHREFQDTKILPVERPIYGPITRI